VRQNLSEAARILELTAGPTDLAQGTADSGDPVAQHALAQMYESGLYYPQSDEDATKWLTRSAEQGFPAAMNSLAYQIGITKTDLPEPILQARQRWLAEAVKRRDYFAMANIGVVLLAQRDIDGAERYLRQAIASREPVFVLWGARGQVPKSSSGFNVLASVARFRGSDEDVIGFLRRAGADPDAEVQLAWQMEQPIGTKSDFTEAVRYYRRAASHGSFFAWSRLRALGVAP
jgi:TPR repeat protein